MSRCGATYLGMGCSAEARPGHGLCEDCRKIAFGPIWDDPILKPLLFWLKWFVREK